MTARPSPRTLTQAELLSEAESRFGPDPMNWAFQCPSCGDVATGADFREVLQANPRKRDGTPVTASQLLGQECIGRLLGALRGGPTRDGGRFRAERGCDWVAYGLFSGPWTISLPDGATMSAFPLAEVAEARS
jgi:hypothetical protein